MTKQPMTAGQKRPRHGCHGAVLVELAILLPLLLTIALGCIDFGRYAYSYIAVTNAAREGAYVASTSPVANASGTAWEQRIRGAVVDEMSAVARFHPDDLAVSASQVAGSGPQRSRVQVGVSYPFRTLVPWVGIPRQLTLSRTVQMRVIR